MAGRKDSGFRRKQELLRQALDLTPSEFKRAMRPVPMRLGPWKYKKCIFLDKKKSHGRYVIFITDKLWLRICGGGWQRRTSREQRYEVLKYYLECSKKRGWYRWEPITYKI